MNIIENDTTLHNPTDWRSTIMTITDHPSTSYLPSSGLKINDSLQSTRSKSKQEINEVGIPQEMTQMNFVLI